MPAITVAMRPSSVISIVAHPPIDLGESTLRGLGTTGAATARSSPALQRAA
ncbi:MAG TPA: hypothetical protein VLA54_08375 [Acidimicrobiia bacterium]|nr:hypothetical protein [Acidimicrobiia bacterium]